MLSRQAYWGLVSNRRYSLELRYIPCIAISNAVWTTLIWFCMFHTCPGLFSHPWICEHLIDHELFQSSSQVCVKSVQLIWAVFTPIPGISYWHLLECVDLNIEVLAVDCIIRRIAQRCIDFLNSIHINGLFQSDGYIRYTSWKN